MTGSDSRFVSGETDYAHSLAEIQAVIEHLARWIEANPQYREAAYPVFEQLYRREEGARESLAEAEQLGLSPTERAQRERLSFLRLRVRAEDLPEVFRPALAEARQALTDWQLAHPDDPLIPVLSEHLDMEEEVASALHAAGAKSQRRPIATQET